MPITWTPQQRWPIVGEDTADRFREFGTWYCGEPVDLARFYRNSSDGELPVRPSQRAGGLVGWFARLFWGQPQIGQIGDMERMHIPAAANISALSADLLYSEPPALTVMAADDEADVDSTDWLQKVATEGGAYAVLAESAELASAYGSAYRRITVDRDKFQYPIVEALPPHCAIPEWWLGQLAAVTFWRVLPDSRNGVLRLLERHEPGSVQHQLRLGTDDKLGQVVPLGSHQETQRIAALADDNGMVATGIPLLDVIHQANIRPCSYFPYDCYGRSDYHGGIPAMQALDETWSLWMDALRLARPRIIVPELYLRDLGPGKGATFDAQQRIFTQIRALDPAQPLQIEQIEFALDVDRYERTTAGNWRTIVRNAGLSADAFGEESSGAQATATEVGQRGARTIATRGRKAEYAAPADRATAAVLLAYGARYYGDQVKPQGEARVVVEFADGVTPDPLKDAEVVQYLDAAHAISLQVKVSTAHPEWSDTAVAEEVARIEKEQQAQRDYEASLSAPDPSADSTLNLDGNVPTPGSSSTTQPGTRSAGY